MRPLFLSPNTLTISRIVLTFFFILAMCAEGFIFKLLGAIIFFLASFTDYYDGYIAKKHKMVSDFGKLMDPIADKFLMLSAFLVFVKMGIVPVIAFLIIFGREVFITFMRLYAKHQGHILAAEKFGKYKTVSQVFCSGVILIYIVLRSADSTNSWSDLTISRWQEFIDFTIMVAVLMTLASGLSYYVNNKQVFRPQ
ncbi:MAG: CDP-diacylglycerol--glycerol-3-phosphate 3-phosphatidyltransferase [Candidatus Omnitrophica bacterium]|nr:CDP-diacylglycerol--glycerol-3-phosphate 3-phosphatidyltransferase [Candidatus Omnitrophota bacterium]